MDFVIPNEDVKEYGLIRCVSLQCLEMLKKDLEEQGVSLEEFFGLYHA